MITFKPCLIIMTLLPAAIGIVLNDDLSQILLIKRRDVPVWVLPGGGIEAGELPSDALKREIFEETGVHVKIIRPCAEYSPANRLSALTFIFLCQIQEGNLSLSEETAEIAFFPLVQLPKSLFHLHTHWIKECLASEELIKRPLTEVSYFALCKHIASHPWQVLRFAWTRFIKRCS